MSFEIGKKYQLRYTHSYHIILSSASFMHLILGFGHVR